MIQYATLTFKTKFSFVKIKSRKVKQVQLPKSFCHPSKHHLSSEFTFLNVKGISQELLGEIGLMEICEDNACRLLRLLLMDMMILGAFFTLQSAYYNCVFRSPTLYTNETIRELLNGYLCTLTLEDFVKFLRNVPILVKIGRT
jgi:hypothetical protein